MAYDQLVYLFQEIGMLAFTPRSGFAFLGSGQQSVADHSFRMTLIAQFLAEQGRYAVDKYKLLMMCLVHDLPEARTGDHNYVNKRYVQVNMQKIFEDMCKASPFGEQMTQWIIEYDDRSSQEAILAHDADQLELLLALKQAYDLGNVSALKWFNKAVDRLVTPEAQELAMTIRNTSYDAWWQQT